MNDYMKSLQKHFDRQEHNELDERIRCVREELRQDLGTESRRRLLHLLDAQNTLLVDSTLMSFTAGFFPQTQTGKLGGQVQPLAAAAMAFFTIRSSREWKVITASRPPGFSRGMAASITRDTAFSSSFTAMRMA